MIGTEERSLDSLLVATVHFTERLVTADHLHDSGLASDFHAASIIVEQSLSSCCLTMTFLQGDVESQ